MKKHSTKRALIASVLALALCFSSLIGTTFAWFTDSVTSTNNVIKTGTLDIGFEKWNGTAWVDTTNTPIFNYTDWEPGYTEIVNLRVVNQGSLALKWQAAITTEKSLSILADAINVYVRSDDQNDTVKDYIAGVDRFGFDAEAEAGNFKKFTLRQFINNLTVMTQGTLVEGQKSYLGIVLQMDPDAGNEYQGLDLGGSFDLTVVATQLTSENDSFGNNSYDANATFPYVAYSNQAVDPAEDLYELPLNLPTGGTVGNVEIKPESVDPEATSVAVKVWETSIYENYTVKTDKNAKTYEIKVYGLDDTNTKPIKVNLYVGEGLTGVTIYHYDTPVSGAIYNEVTGIVTFETLDFSPFTVEFDALGVEAGPAPEKPDTPLTAIVKDMDKYENVNLVWDSFGGFSALPNGYQLESVYEFTAPDSAEDVADSYYKNWWCDYYVMMDRDVAEGALLLGGNYGDWGWVGFTNPIAVEADVEVPLLGFALNPENPRVDTLTYEGVVNFVETFICGVAHTDASLNGATFTVMLRLTNPEDFSDYFNAAVVEYTFDDAPMNWEDYKDMPAYVETINEEE